MKLRRCDNEMQCVILDDILEQKKTISVGQWAKFEVCNTDNKLISWFGNSTVVT